MAISFLLFKDSARFLFVADLDPLGPGRLLQLRHDDAEDAVLQAGPDILLVDAVGEAEAPRELADAAFRHPVRVLRVMLAHLLGACGGDRGAGGLLLLLAFVGLAILLLARLAGFLAFLPIVFRPPFDRQSLLVGKLDGHVLLIDAGEFAFEDVLVLGLLDVELGREAA